MSEDAESALVKRAFALAKTGEFTGWVDVRTALIAEGYLLLNSPGINENSILHEAVGIACSRARDGRATL